MENFVHRQLDCCDSHGFEWVLMEAPPSLGHPHLVRSDATRLHHPAGHHGSQPLGQKRDSEEGKQILTKRFTLANAKAFAV